MMEKNNEKVLSFDAEELQAYEPNRYPYLFIDRVTECIPGKYAKGYKNLTNNEWFFPRHYVGHPIMPGVIQAEALSQMVTVAITTLPEIEDINVVGVKISAQYHREIYPGDRLDIEAFVKSYTRGIGKGYAKSYVDGQLACEIEVTLAVPSELAKYKPKKKIEEK